MSYTRTAILKGVTAPAFEKQTGGDERDASYGYEHQQGCPAKLWHAADKTPGVCAAGEQAEGERAPGRQGGDINPSKVYVDVLAEFTRDGFLRPCRITWEDGRKYMIDRVKGCERRASRKAGGMGLMYTCMIGGQEVNLFYEENQRWFVTRK